jgi:hypothetical protein
VTHPSLEVRLCVGTARGFFMCDVNEGGE